MAKGDQMYVYRDFPPPLQGVYQHHGIDCGDGSVIHYRKPSEVVDRTSLEVFAKGQKIYVREYTEGFCFIPDVVVDRAKSRLGEKKYNLVYNNCEHFATWCKTGISDSKQVRDFIPVINNIDITKLYNPLKDSFETGDPQNSQQLLNQALADIKVVWEQLQPQYQESLKEIKAWEDVAKEALKRDRNDLARAAITKKLSYKKRATELKQQLNQLAQMTETLVKNSQSLRK